MSANWTELLTAEEQQVIRDFVVAMGNITALAKEYGVSYPTMRRKIGLIVRKIRVEPTKEDAFLNALSTIFDQKDAGSLSPKLQAKIKAEYLRNKIDG